MIFSRAMPLRQTGHSAALGCLLFIQPQRHGQQ
jgi:hypothetical protein